MTTNGETVGEVSHKFFSEKYETTSKYFQKTILITCSFLCASVFLTFIFKGFGPVRATLTLLCIGYIITLTNANVSKALGFGLIGYISLRKEPRPISSVSER